MEKCSNDRIRWENGEEQEGLREQRMETQAGAREALEDDVMERRVGEEREG